MCVAVLRRPSVCCIATEWIMWLPEIGLKYILIRISINVHFNCVLFHLFWVCRCILALDRLHYTVLGTLALLYKWTCGVYVNTVMQTSVTHRNSISVRLGAWCKPVRVPIIDLRDKPTHMRLFPFCAYTRDRQLSTWSRRLRLAIKTSNYIYDTSLTDATAAKQLATRKALHDRASNSELIE